MARIVQNTAGTPVGRRPERMQKARGRIKAFGDEGNELVVVVSAAPRVTERASDCPRESGPWRRGRPRAANLDQLSIGSQEHRAHRNGAPSVSVSSREFHRPRSGHLHRQGAHQGENQNDQRGTARKRFEAAG